MPASIQSLTERSVTLSPLLRTVEAGVWAGHLTPLGAAGFAGAASLTVGAEAAYRVSLLMAGVAGSSCVLFGAVPFDAGFAGSAALTVRLNGSKVATVVMSGSATMTAQAVRTFLVAFYAGGAGGFTAGSLRNRGVLPEFDGAGASSALLDGSKVIAAVIAAGASGFTANRLFNLGLTPGFAGVASLLVGAQVAYSIRPSAAGVGGFALLPRLAGVVEDSTSAAVTDSTGAAVTGFY